VRIVAPASFGLPLAKGFWLRYPLLMAEEVKHSGRQRGTRISSKHQVTIPVATMAATGLRAGDRLRAEPAGRGRVVLVRVEDPVRRHAGRLTGVFGAGELHRLRDEWR
jgi:bifunctional DNA-binding transcriptional regulator/antitoxin component of YhaV-PrlF toxin-antitoxin module